MKKLLILITALFTLTACSSKEEQFQMPKNVTELKNYLDKENKNISINLIDSSGKELEEAVLKIDGLKTYYISKEIDLNGNETIIDETYIEITNNAYYVYYLENDEWNKIQTKDEIYSEFNILKMDPDNFEETSSNIYTFDDIASNIKYTLTFSENEIDYKLEKKLNDVYIEFGSAKFYDFQTTKITLPIATDVTPKEEDNINI